MLPYWILFLIFALGAIEYRRHDHQFGTQSMLILSAAGVAMALMIGLRYEVGSDWSNYFQIYEDIRYLDLTAVLSLGDPGYAALNWLGHSLGFEIWFVNLVCAAIFSWGLIKFARAQSNPWLAVLVAVPYLVIVVAMGYTRQGVAIGFILAALASFGVSSFARIAFYVVCAVTFHRSAIIVLPLLALAVTERRIFIVGLLIVLMAILYYLFVQAVLDAMVQSYFGADYSAEGATVRVLMNLPPALCFLYFQRRFGLPTEQRKLWRNFALAAIACLAALILFPSSAAIDRIALYVIPLQMFVLSRLPEIFRDRERVNSQLLVAVIAYSATIQIVWLNFSQYIASWVPYRLYFLSL